MKNQDIQAQVALIFPLIDKNFVLAQKEYQSGELSNGAFRYVLGRHLMAHDVIHNSTLNEVEPESLYKQLAILTIDVRAAVDDYPEQKHILDNWLKFYVDAGFTEMHSFLNIPVFVEPQLSLNI
jgi:hypothetical protein